MNLSTAKPSTTDSLQADTRRFYESDGRLGRASYITWNFIIFLISLICFLALIAIYWNDLYAVFNLASYDNYAAIVQIQETLAPLNAFSSLINFVYLYFMFIFSIKRLHDLNRSGWMSLLNIIPLVNLFFAVWLSAAKGSEGKNDFGYPRKTRTWEYTMAWGSVVLVIFIGIALIFALSQLIKYLA